MWRWSSLLDLVFFYFWTNFFVDSWTLYSEDRRKGSRLDPLGICSRIWAGICCFKAWFFIFYFWLIVWEKEGRGFHCDGELLSGEDQGGDTLYQRLCFRFFTFFCYKKTIFFVCLFGLILVWFSIFVDSWMLSLRLIVFCLRGFGFLNICCVI